MAPPGGPVPPGPGAPHGPATGQQPAAGHGAPGPAVPGFPGGGTVPGSGPAPSAEDPTWAMIAHLAGVVTACLGWVPALLVLSSQKHRSAFGRHHAAEALNFQLTLLIPYALAWIVYIVLAFLTPAVSWIGSVLIALIWGLSILFGVLAAANANKGGWYRYPVALRPVK
ncbi:DUF4870 domain-containing protein [Nocardiopsis halophila]|uniref:DUF4870 domain-containing protein n=1 Tax=Nocardiopsis halophila TaxID=141692 RepID=UPI0003479CED|nr:DUF4870 domain-containing protein [Nocardiopsis halophila]